MSSRAVGVAEGQTHLQLQELSEEYRAAVDEYRRIIIERNQLWVKHLDMEGPQAQAWDRVIKARRAMQAMHEDTNSWPDDRR
jgi:hypothetical protein